jgi:hypothetical protein
MIKQHKPKWFAKAKLCVECGKEFLPLCWKGKDRWRCETRQRYEKKQFCNNECRSKYLAKQSPESNYFFGKHLKPYNKGKRKEIWRVKCGRYIKLFYNDGKFEYEHRKVAREVYGDIDGLIIHHINQDGRDNRRENLEPMTSKEHKRLHHQLAKQLS